MRILVYSAKMEWKHHPIINVWINYIFTQSSSTRNLCHIWAGKFVQITLAQKIGFSNYIPYLCLQIQGQYDAKWLWPIRCTKFCDCIIPLITNGVREMFGSPTERIQKQYAESKMGYLEDRIITKGNFQALPHLVLNMCQSGIVFPQKGGNIFTELVSNLHWDIKPAE